MQDDEKTEDALSENAAVPTVMTPPEPAERSPYPNGEDLGMLLCIAAYLASVDTDAWEKQQALSLIQLAAVRMLPRATRAEATHCAASIADPKLREVAERALHLVKPWA